MTATTECPCGADYCPGCRRGFYLARQAEKGKRRQNGSDGAPAP